MSVPGNTPTWPYIDGMSTPDADSGDKNPCTDDIQKEKEKCAEYKPHKKNGEDACAEGDVVAYPQSGSDAEGPLDDGRRLP